MIGNDIVDLKLASIQNNWQRKGFLNKVFTKNEQQLIANEKNSFQMVWHLWSMKESAYKIHVQQHRKRFFDPKKLCCYLTNKSDGFVVINNEKYKTKTTIESNFIYTNAVLDTSKKNIENHSFYIEDSSVENQRSKTYKQLKTIVSKTHQLSFKYLEIKKTTAGIPKLYEHNNCLDIPFSITHHGNYGAISILN